jgi:hypothetical protein
MKLHATDVMARCVERGYSWEEIAPCLTQDLGGGWFEVNVDHPAYPRTQRPGTTPPKAGLGDMVASALTAIGITKERVALVVGGDCGCTKRQEKLNELGRKIGIG